MQTFEGFNKHMQDEFEMSDLVRMAYFLRMEIKQCKTGIFICQKKYATEMLRKFGLENCKPATTHLAQNDKLLKDDGVAKVDGSVYRSLIGCFLYLCDTKPDIMFSTVPLACCPDLCKILVRFTLRLEKEF